MKTNMALTILKLTGVLLTFSCSARADNFDFTVSLDTSPLMAAPANGAGPFSLAFQLTDGSGLGDFLNTATISNFQFGAGGSSGSCPANCTTFGGASGDTASTVVLTDSSFFNAFVETFTPGASLSFTVDLTTNVLTGGTPDAFAFSILDSSGNPIPTLDPTSADTLATVNIDSATPAFEGYATDPSLNSEGGDGPAITMAAPTATTVVPVPEPGGTALLAAAIGCVLLVAIRRKKDSRRPGVR
jgi:hypothetical protein